MCPDCLPSLEVEVLFFPVFFPTAVAVRFYSASIAIKGQGSVWTRACSPHYLPFLPHLSKMCIMWQGELLFFFGDSAVQAATLQYESFHIWTRSCRKLSSARWYLFLKFASYLRPGYFCKSCFFWWKDTRDNVERGPITVVSQQIWYEHWCATCCALDLQLCCSVCPMWFCVLLSGILFVASLQIKAESLLPYPTLKQNVLCK